MLHALLKRGLQLLELFKEDFEKIGARDLHDLLRCWELRDRLWCAEGHIRHVLFREETRWPGYYYRADFPALDEENWKVLVYSRYDAASGDWQLSKRLYIPLILWREARVLSPAVAFLSAGLNSTFQAVFHERC